jgi:hypothetical protein
LDAIAGWRKGFEGIEPGLTFKVLREATRIAAWERPDWGEIHRILAGEG